MANETTTTTITGTLYSQYIVPNMLDYAIAASVISPFCRVANLEGKGSKVAQFNVPTKSSGVAALTEGTAMSNSALTISAGTQATVAEVGILREYTKMSARLGTMTEAELLQFIVEDGTKLCMEKFETDIAATFTSAAASVGTSGANFTLANFAGGISALGTANAKGKAVFIASDKQARDLRAALMASTATIFANGSGGQILEQMRPDGYVGNLLGTDIWQTTLCTTANAAVDKVGCFLIDGNNYPKNAAIGVGLGWLPEPEYIGHPEMPSRRSAVTMAYGVAMISTFNAVKAVTTAT